MIAFLIGVIVGIVLSALAIVAFFELAEKYW
jgi:hypothetical protein